MVRLALLGLTLLLLAQCGAATVPPGPTIPVTIGGHTVRATIASTPEQRQRGLMGRAQLADDEGMLFVYAADRTGLWYWMKDTPTPLSIAFLEADRRVINTHDMRPLDDTTRYYANGPTRYALEVAQGWFTRHGVTPGDVVTFTLPDGLEIR